MLPSATSMLRPATRQGAWASPGALGAHDHVRAAGRVLAIVGVSLAAAALLVAAQALRALAGRPGLLLADRATRLWAVLIARVIGMRVAVHGVVPPAGSLLVANHLGYIDVVALWCATNGVFVAKAELASWPVVGLLGRAARTIFIDRGRKRDIPRVLSEMARRLRSGETVIVFPEATSSAGDGVLPFRSPLFQASVRSGVPVTCASLAYRTGPDAPRADEAVCWWGDMTFVDHLYRLLRLPDFDATLRFTPARIGAGDRKQRAREAREEVTACFTPTARRP